MYLLVFLFISALFDVQHVGVPYFTITQLYPTMQNFKRNQNVHIYVNQYISMSTTTYLCQSIHIYVNQYISMSINTYRQHLLKLKVKCSTNNYFLWQQNKIHNYNLLIYKKPIPIFPFLQSMQKQFFVVHFLIDFFDAVKELYLFEIFGSNVKYLQSNIPDSLIAIKNSSCKKYPQITLLVKIVIVIR